MWKPNESQKSLIRSAYERCTLTVDRLPFSAEFDLVFAELNFEGVTKNELFMALANMRKRKELPRKPR